VSRIVMSQNLFCKTNKAFRLYLTKYFVFDLNPNNRIRVTRFQQPGTRFLDRVISQLTKFIYRSSIPHLLAPKIHNHDMPLVVGPSETITESWLPMLSAIFQFHWQIT